MPLFWFLDFQPSAKFTEANRGICFGVQCSRFTELKTWFWSRWNLWARSSDQQISIVGMLEDSHIYLYYENTGLDQRRRNRGSNAWIHESIGERITGQSGFVELAATKWSWKRGSFKTTANSVIWNNSRPREEVRFTSNPRNSLRLFLLDVICCRLMLLVREKPKIHFFKIQVLSRIW